MYARVSSGGQCVCRNGDGDFWAVCVLSFGKAGFWVRETVKDWVGLVLGLGIHMTPRVNSITNLDGVKEFESIEKN